MSEISIILLEQYPKTCESAQNTTQKLLSEWSQFLEVQITLALLKHKKN